METEAHHSDARSNMPSPDTVVRDPARLLEAADGVGVALVTHAADGTLHSANRAACHLLQCSAEELVGQGWSAIVAPPDARELRAAGVQGRVPTSRACRLAGDGGGPGWVFVAMRPGGDDPRDDVFISELVDLDAITSDVRQHPQGSFADLQHSHERFVTIASHELRTPVTSIQGFASTLLDQWDVCTDARRREFVELIGEAAERMGELVENLLTITAIDAGRLHGNPRAVPVDQVFAGLVEQFRGREIIMPPRSDAAVFADPAHFGTMLTNYLRNACRYGRDPIVVEVAVHATEVVISVSDAGAGVPASFHPHLFERFSQPSQADTRESRGLGLGLAATRDLARANAGDAWCHLGPGETRFCLRLPAAGHLLMTPRADVKDGG